MSARGSATPSFPMRARAEILEPDLVTGILDEAMGVLETTGVTIGDEGAYGQLCERGFVGGEEGQVKIPRAIVEQAIASAPSSISLFDREGEPHATLCGDRVHFVPASSALKIRDEVTQVMRDATSTDFVRYVKVADGLEHIDYLSTAFVPKDVPEGRGRCLAPVAVPGALEAAGGVGRLHGRRCGAYRARARSVPQRSRRAGSQAPRDPHRLPETRRCAGARTRCAT